MADAFYFKFFTDALNNVVRGVAGRLIHEENAIYFDFMSV